MKIINLIKSEFIKNYTLNKLLGTFLILLFIVIVTIEFQEMYYNQYNNDIDIFEQYKRDYNNYQTNPLENSLEQEYKLYFNKVGVDIAQEINSNNQFKEHSWQAELLDSLITLKKQEFFLDKYLNNEEISLDILKYDNVLSYVEEFSLLSEEELDERKEIINQYYYLGLELLKENKFYKYVEFQLELNELYKNNNYVEIGLLDYMIIDENEKYYRIIVDKKIEDENNYYVKNLYQSMGIGSTGYDSEYVKKVSKKYMEEVYAIIDYSLEHNKKHDLISNGIVDLNGENFYITSKTMVNQVTGILITVVVLILVVITSGDIVSREHTLGTEKRLLATPNKRWKILLSKFIYMILNMYIIWFMVLILLSIYEGIKYGFSDLFTPKLIYQDKVIEVNYYLYTIKEIFYVSIPVIALISIILMLSTVTLNTSLTVGITMAISILSALLWHVIQQFKLYFLAYTPLPYFVYSQVLNYNENFLKTISVIKTSSSTGIIISVITIIVCYLVSHIIYTKRDIKN